MGFAQQQRRWGWLTWPGMTLVLMMGVQCSGPTPGTLPDVPACIRSSDCPVESSCQGGICVKLSTPLDAPPLDADTEKSSTEKNLDAQIDTLPEPPSRREPPTDKELAPPPEETTPPERRDAGREPTPEPPDLAECTDKSTRPCYTGTAKTRGIGACKDGRQVCNQGVWEACVGEILPTAESCDKKDNNCNGTVDEALSQPCYTGPAGTHNIGLCKGGTQVCQAGEWGTCAGEVKPSPEKCDGQDNDCNGNPDDNCTCKLGTSRRCGSKVGACTQGTQQCVAGNWGTCVGGVRPKTETCDGVDNNCDGQVDNNPQGLGSACTVPALKGECSKGRSICSEGRIKCQQVNPIRPETCDNKDNDCDGIIDKFGINTSCIIPSRQGECRIGRYYCSSGSTSCLQSIYPQAERCDGKDTNCDGQVDACTPGQTRCNTAKTGVETCNSTCEGWAPAKICPERACSNGVCCVCKPGQTRCGATNSRIEETCNNNCAGWTRKSCPASAPFCFTGYMNTCKNCNCAPTSHNCSGDRRHRRICDSNCFTSRNIQTCPNGTKCYKNVSIGTTRCQ